VIGDGTHQERRGHRGAEQAYLIERSARTIKPAEANGERQAQQKPEEHLHTETGHAKFLKKIAQVPIIPFCF
jgi:hypothetical protein